jgi:hypothetical protein
MVQVRGLIKATGDRQGDFLVWQVPEGYRPPKAVVLSGVQSDVAGPGGVIVSQFQVSASGRFATYTPMTANQFVSIECEWYAGGTVTGDLAYTKAEADAKFVRSTAPQVMFAGVATLQTSQSAESKVTIQIPPGVFTTPPLIVASFNADPTSADGTQRGVLWVDQITTTSFRVNGASDAKWVYSTPFTWIAVGT